MPRFYFNFRNGERAAENEGLEFENLEAARREAITSILEISNEGGVPATDHREWIVDVHQDASPVLEVALILTIKRIKSS